VGRGVLVLRRRPFARGVFFRFVAEQGGGDFVGGPRVRIDGVNAGHRRHPAVARVLLRGLERGDLRTILLHQRHAFAVGGSDQQFRFAGREDELIYYWLAVPADLAGREKWQDLRTIGVVARISKGGGKCTSNARYYISSLRLGVKRFATCVRGHWGIEDTLHWCLDVTFREDESRVRHRTLADNLA